MYSLRNISNELRVATVLICMVPASYGRTAETQTTDPIFSLEPELGIEVRYDENIFRSATSIQSSWITIISPGLSVSTEPSRHRFSVQYNGDIAWYANSDPDNYDDHHLEAGAYLDLSPKTKFDLIGSYDDSHDNRGTALTEGFDPALNVPPNPDEYQFGKLLGRFSLGSSASKGRLVLEGGVSDLEYTNHRDRTRFFDRADTYGNATFYFRILPRTSLLLDTRFSEIDYANDRALLPSLDSKEFRYLVGITWDTTAKITGTLKAGYVEKNFDDSARGDFSDPSWEADLRWSPRTYSHFDFRTARYPSESNGGGNFIDNTVYSITWEHAWSDRTNSRIGARQLDQEYRGSFVNRNQELTQFDFSVSYQMRRWLTWKAGIEINSRNSNIDRFEFDGNIYSVSAVMTL